MNNSEGRPSGEGYVGESPSVNYSNDIVETNKHLSWS
jgi:hypothetical protein